MAITSEVVGGLNTPGYVFLNQSAKTYDLPRFPQGCNITTVNWAGSGEMSYDFINKATGDVFQGKKLTVTGHNVTFPADWLNEVHPNGVLLRFNNGTPTLVAIVPNEMKTPPVWNG